MPGIRRLGLKALAGDESFRGQFHDRGHSSPPEVKIELTFKAEVRQADEVKLKKRGESVSVRLTEVMLKKGTRKCRVCKQTKPISEFILNLNNKWMPHDCRDCEKKRRLKRRSGVESQKEFIKGYRDKPEECEVCGSKHTVCYDHCHLTNLHRGYLCHKCNTILGFVDDSPDRLRGLAEYIEKFYRSPQILSLISSDRLKDEEEHVLKTKTNGRNY